MTVPDLTSVAGVAAWLVGGGGVAWTAVRVSLNGTRARVERIEKKLDIVIESMSETRERLARLEGEHRHRRSG